MEWHALVFAVLAWAGPTQGPAIEASALVVQGRTSEARRVALKRALKRAVLQEAASRRPRAANWKARIEAAYQRYVLGYRILDEGLSGTSTQGSYRVKVQVQIDRLALARDLDRLSAPPISLCVTWSWDEPPSAQVRRAAMAALRSTGIPSNCRGTQHLYRLRASCRIATLGTVPGGIGATASCSAQVEGAHGTASVATQAAGLSPRRGDAEREALVVAASRLGWKVATMLTRTGRCPTLWTLKLTGNWPLQKVEELVAQIRRRLGRNALLTLDIRTPGRFEAAQRTPVSLLVRSPWCGLTWLGDLGFEDADIRPNIRGGTISLGLEPHPLDVEGEVSGHVP